MTKTPQSIVVACDGSEQSLHAVEMAAELAKATENPLSLLSVFPGSEAERMVISGTRPEQLEEKVEKYGNEIFDKAKETVGNKAGIKETILLKGDPAAEIIEYLESNPGSHLVLGRRGHSLVRSLTLGSISEKVVRHVTVPVTVVGG